MNHGLALREPPALTVYSIGSVQLISRRLRREVSLHEAAPRPPWPARAAARFLLHSSRRWRHGGGPGGRRPRPGPGRVVALEELLGCRGVLDLLWPACRAAGRRSGSIAVAWVRPASAQGGPGVRGGLGANPDQFFIGAHYVTAPIGICLRFQPNVEAGFGDDRTVVAFDMEFGYWMKGELLLAGVRGRRTGAQPREP